MNLKPIIHIRLIILKSLFRCFDTLSNFQKLHKCVVSKKVYLGTAILSLSLVNSACNSKNGTNVHQKANKKLEKDTTSKVKCDKDSSLKKIYTTNNKVTNLVSCYIMPKVIDRPREDSVVDVDVISCYVMVASPPPTTKDESRINKKDSIIEENQEPAFIVVEENATFQGGDLNTFRNWVQEKLVYPEKSAEDGSQGRVFIQFAVNSKGDICDIKVLRSTGDPLLDEEAIRVIKTSPQWKPARQGGANVKQQFTMPVTFKLQQ